MVRTPSRPAESKVGPNHLPGPTQRSQFSRSGVQTDGTSSCGCRVGAAVEPTGRDPPWRRCMTWTCWCRAQSLLLEKGARSLGSAYLTSTYCVHSARCNPLGPRTMTESVTVTNKETPVNCTVTRPPWGLPRTWESGEVSAGSNSLVKTQPKEFSKCSHNAGIVATLK